ncbi:MAG: carboxypeptidase regulatory-like domain-containing protein, partial [Acidobacteriia bacterium]|nr:carboxypeptidase regulatory-like domain-containing protein [Terriglobia bacterium]
MKAIYFIILLTVSLSTVWAQSTAQMQGTVTDSSGSAVPAAEVKVTQTDTGSVRTVATDQGGGYVLTNLPIGPYRMEVTKTGFTTYIQTGIVLQVATNPTIDVQMKVGAVNEQVQVEANAALVEAQATGVGQVIENTRILELPLNGRLATDLIQLSGATITQGVAGAGGIPNTGQIVVAGGQAFGDLYLLDGGLFNNPWDSAFLPFPFPDALQEFKVETSSLTAQNGIHSGAAITAVTKSGTNSFHGDAFDFLRNGDLNARNFFAPTRDTLKRNQYGGVIGGPVMKDKLFFFFGYQGT